MDRVADESITPKTPADLDRRALTRAGRNRSDLALAEEISLSFSPGHLVLRTSSHPAQRAAARAGVGIALVLVPAEGFRVFR